MCSCNIVNDYNYIVLSTSYRYDNLLVRGQLPGKLGLPETEQPFVVKKGNAYVCLQSQKFKILDVSQYLGSGCSYDKFLQSYQVETRKGYFPYDWFDDVSKLEFPTLPPPEAFYSELKRCNTLGNSKEEIMSNHKKLQDIWQRENMSTFRHYLEFYNLLDVGPFVQGLQKLMTFYTDRAIDIFKTTISIPGVARALLFQTARENHAHFSLFDGTQQELYKKFKDNITGGASLVFHRELEAGKTLLRGNPNKICKKIIGMDANALYLFAIAQDQPVGRCIVRREENNFRPEIRDKYFSQFDYLDYTAEKEGIHIQHAMNGGEKMIGPYRLDG